jgi:hypothetical protein
MIAPFAIFATSDDGTLQKGRTRHYVIDGFDRLYAGRLKALGSWQDWEHLVSLLEDKAAGAFEGTVNLHEYANHIDRLAETYERLKLAYGSRYRDLSPPA